MSNQVQKFKKKHDISSHRCYYCNDELTTESCEVDHKMPLSRGGTNKQNNLVLACRKCNRMKSNLTYDEFILQAKKIIYYSE